jgi:hypothetical protein
MEENVGKVDRSMLSLNIRARVIFKSCEFVYEMFDEHVLIVSVGKQ